MGDTIKNIMAQVFQIEAASIVADTSPESVERWDSLKHMQLVMALEDEFGIEFPDEVIPELLSYVKIVDQVEVLRSARG
jgi:acyl carrier protein